MSKKKNKTIINEFKNELPYIEDGFNDKQYDLIVKVMKNSIEKTSAFTNTQKIKTMTDDIKPLFICCGMNYLTFATLLTAFLTIKNDNDRYNLTQAFCNNLIQFLEKCEVKKK